MAQTVVDVNELSRSFARRTALNGVSFHATARPIVLARAGRGRQQVEVA